MLQRANWAAVCVVFGLATAPAWAVGVGDPAPEIRADRWYNTSGPVSLANCRGQVVVVEFWATYCAPCHQVQPKLVRIHQKWSQKGVVLISMSDEPDAIVAPFISKHPSPYIVTAGGDTPRRYGITGIPAAFVIDRNGDVCWRGNPHEGTFEDAIERAVIGGDRFGPGRQQSPDEGWTAPPRPERGFTPPVAQPQRVSRTSARVTSSQQPFEGSRSRAVTKSSVKKNPKAPSRNAAKKSKSGKKSASKAPTTKRKSAKSKSARKSSKGRAIKSRSAKPVAKSAKSSKAKPSKSKQYKKSTTRSKKVRK